MSISFNNALGIHQHTVGVRNRRAELIASNIANANTPGFKAKGMDFSVALQAAASKARVGMSKTNERHLYAGKTIVGEELYRVPTQPDTGDGNTVDVQLENNLFMQNSLEYQAGLDFLGGKFEKMTKALGGGQ